MERLSHLPKTPRHNPVSGVPVTDARRIETAEARSIADKGPHSCDFQKRMAASESLRGAERSVYVP